MKNEPMTVIIRMSDHNFLSSVNFAQGRLSDATFKPDPEDALDFLCSTDAIDFLHDCKVRYPDEEFHLVLEFNPSHICAY